MTRPGAQVAIDRHRRLASEWSGAGTPTLTEHDRDLLFEDEGVA
jgi:hypothetical protein